MMATARRSGTAARRSRPSPGSSRRRRRAALRFARSRGCSTFHHPVSYRMLMSERDKNATVFLDFDGTISRADVVDAILEKFAGPAWLRLEEEWRARRLGARAGLQRQMAAVRGAPAAVGGPLDRVRHAAGVAARPAPPAARGVA